MLLLMFILFSLLHKRIVDIFPQLFNNLCCLLFYFVNSLFKFTILNLFLQNALFCFRNHLLTHLISPDNTRFYRNNENNAVVRLSSDTRLLVRLWMKKCFCSTWRDNRFVIVFVCLSVAQHKKMFHATPARTHASRFVVQA